MIRKNVFLILNNVVCELYRCQTYAELGQFFLPVLRMLIPFRYASIMRRENTTEHIRLVDPLCIPSEFLEAEQNYMRFADDDYTGWLNCCRESTLFRESTWSGSSSGCALPSIRSVTRSSMFTTPFSMASCSTGGPWGR